MLVGMSAYYSVTPVLKMARSWKPLRSEQTSRPEAVASTSSTGVEVNPAVLLRGEWRVCGDFQRRHRTRERRAAPRGEQHNLCARRSQRRRRHKIVAGGGQQVQAGRVDALAIRQHIAHGGEAALLRAAQRLVFQRGNAARLVAGGRIFVNRLVMFLEIALEVVNQPNRLVEQLRRVAAIHQDGFRAEHLRHFGQNRRAAHAAQQVGEAADDRVRRDAGEAVRTAALQPNHKFAGRAGDTLLIPHVVRKLTQQLHRFGKLIFHLLADEKAHARLVVVAHVFLDDGGAGIFAAQPQHQHAADVGVRRQIRQNRARILLIIAHL